jgi:SAM-dependent methyltransferase
LTRHTAGRQALIDIYATHPLREDTILERVLRRRGTLEGLTELDLAHDSLTEITDRNHVGDVGSLVQLALAAGVQSTSRVLDIGSGLGGSARCLACFFGCRVDGVELSPARCEQAARLTTLVGLDHLVSFQCGDILSTVLPARAFDVIWGQGAWLHIPDAAALFALAARALAPRGRMAFEEAYLARAPRGASEVSALAELERLWGGAFLSREDWRAALGSASLEVTAFDAMTNQFLAHFERLAHIARAQGQGQFPVHEMDAYTRAIELARDGVIGYSRVIARRLPVP